MRSFLISSSVLRTNGVKSPFIRLPGVGDGRGGAHQGCRGHVVRPGGVVLEDPALADVTGGDFGGRAGARAINSRAHDAQHRLYDVGIVDIFHARRVLGGQRQPHPLAARHLQQGKDLVQASDLDKLIQDDPYFVVARPHPRAAYLCQEQAHDCL